MGFHDAFAACLSGQTTAEAWGTALGLRVYQNTVALGELAALQANFPTVQTLLGAEGFAALATAFAQAHPPSEVSLLRYGANLPSFIAESPLAQDLPYLAGVAELDAAWTLSHTAAEASPLPAFDAAALMQLLQVDACVQAHPSALSFYFADMPVAQIWLRTRAAQTDLSDLMWAGGGVLMVRPEHEVRYAACSASAHALLCRLRSPTRLRSLFEGAEALAADVSAIESLGADLFHLFSQQAVVVCASTP